MATPAETLQTFDALTEDEQREIAAAIVVRTIGDPSAKVADNLWYIVVGTFALVVVGGLLALVVMVWNSKSTDVIAPFVTLAAGILGGLLAPSPVTKES